MYTKLHKSADLTVAARWVRQGDTLTPTRRFYGNLQEIWCYMNFSKCVSFSVLKSLYTKESRKIAYLVETSVYRTTKYCLWKNAYASVTTCGSQKMIKHVCTTYMKKIDPWEELVSFPTSRTTRISCRLRNSQNYTIRYTEDD